MIGRIWGWDLVMNVLDLRSKLICKTPKRFIMPHYHSLV